MFKEIKQTLATCLFVALSSSLVFALDVPANKIVDVSWLSRNLGDKNLVLIDVREGKADYKLSHIPNAIHWEVGDFREGRLNLPGYIGSPTQFERLAQNSGITSDSAVIFYSDGNKSAADYSVATLALHIGEFYGITNAAILDGGFAAWVKNAKATSSDMPKVEKSSFEISKVNTDIVATIYDMDAAVETTSRELVDARGEALYKGEQAHPKVAKVGHVLGAKNVFIGKIVENKDGIFYFKSPEALKQVLSYAGVNMSKPIIWYCNTGWNASGGWFATKYILGKSDVKAYDGSMTEYSVLPKRKMVKD